MDDPTAAITAISTPPVFNSKILKRKLVPKCQAKRFFISPFQTGVLKTKSDKSDKPGNKSETHAGKHPKTMPPNFQK